MGKGAKALIKFEKLDPNSRFKNPLYAMKQISSSRSLSVESVTNNIGLSHRSEFKTSSPFTKEPNPNNNISCLKKCHTINNYIKYETIDKKDDIIFKVDTDLNNYENNNNKDEKHYNCKENGQFELKCRNPLYRKKKRDSSTDHHHHHHHHHNLNDKVNLNFENGMVINSDVALVGTSSGVCDSYFDIQITDILMDSMRGMTSNGDDINSSSSKIDGDDDNGSGRQIIVKHHGYLSKSELLNEKSDIRNDDDDINKNKIEIEINQTIEKEKKSTGKHRRSVARDVFEIDENHDIEMEIQKQHNQSLSIENMIYDPYGNSFELPLNYYGTSQDYDSYSSYTFNETNDIEINSQMNSNISDYTQICSQKPLTLNSCRALSLLHDGSSVQKKRSFLKNARMFFSEKYNDTKIVQDAMKNDMKSQLSKSWSAGLDVEFERPKKEKKKSIIPKIVRKMGRALGKKLKMQPKDTKVKGSKFKKVMNMTFAKRTTNVNQNIRANRSAIFRKSYPEGICGIFTKECTKSEKTLHSSGKSKINSHSILESVPSWNNGPMDEPKEMPPLNEILRCKSDTSEVGMYSDSHFTMEAGTTTDVLSEFEDIISNKSDTPTFLHLTSTEFHSPQLFNNNVILKMEGLWRPYWSKCNVTDIDRSIYVSKGFEKISQDINYLEIYLYKQQTIKLYKHNGRRKFIEKINFDPQNDNNLTSHGYLTSRGFRSISKEDDLSREELYWLDNHDQTLHLEMLIISDSGNSRTINMCFIKESNL